MKKSNIFLHAMLLFLFMGSQIETRFDGEGLEEAQRSFARKLEETWRSQSEAWKRKGDAATDSCSVMVDALTGSVRKSREQTATDAVSEFNKTPWPVTVNGAFVGSVAAGVGTTFKFITRPSPKRVGLGSRVFLSTMLARFVYDEYCMFYLKRPVIIDSPRQAPCQDCLARKKQESQVVDKVKQVDRSTPIEAPAGDLGRNDDGNIDEDKLNRDDDPDIFED